MSIAGLFSAELPQSTPLHSSRGNGKQKTPLPLLAPKSASFKPLEIHTLFRSWHNRYLYSTVVLDFSVSSLHSFFSLFHSQSLPVRSDSDLTQASPFFFGFLWLSSSLLAAGIKYEKVGLGSGSNRFAAQPESPRQMGVWGRETGT
jgi:hypothetical protein